MIALPLLLALAARAQDDTAAPAGDAVEVVEDGIFEPLLNEAARQHLLAAQKSERAGEWRQAAAGYELVLQSDPTYVEAVLGLGRAYEAMGDPGRAAAAYERLPNEADAVEALGLLVEDDDPRRAARLYEALTTLRLGDPEPHRYLARALVRFDPPAAAEELDTYLNLLDLSAGDPDGALILSVAVALRDGGLEDEAVAWLERLLALLPEGDQVAEARGRLDRIAVERAARALAVGGAEPLSAELARRVEEARRDAARGRLDDALAILRDVVQRAPRAAEARAALGDVHEVMGEVAGAERDFVWAAALEPDESAWHARLGTLLADRYGGRRHREASEELERALALRPSWAELHFRLARVYQESGRFDEAVKAYRAYEAAEPEGPHLATARQAIADLTREAPEPPAVSADSRPPAQVPAEALDRYRVARVYLDRGELDLARQELVQVLPLAPRWPAAINLQAALLLRLGKTEEAARAWEQSLDLEGAQPQVRLALGELRRGQGRVEEARRLFDEAARGGAADAWYKLAVMAWDDGDLFLANRKLDAYFAASTGGLSHEPALDLQARVKRRILTLQLGAAGLGAALLGGVLVVVLRRRTARPLAALLARAPEASHDLARHLSAIRHEVLKHNTTLLDEVAHALEHGDHHAVAFAAVRLYGEPGDGGIIARFEEDLAAITRLGRRHGVRLDLKRRDPVLSPMWRAMRRLRRLEGAMRRPWRARSGVPAELRALSDVLNRTGYQALGRLLREMGTIGVDEELLRAVDARVRAEPGLADRPLPPLELDTPAWPLPARVFRGDLEDVVANLLRNAYAVLRESPPSCRPRVGLALDEEDDPITGLEHVTLRFRDNAPGGLSDAMIHGRGIGRGLGLVVDLVARHEGSIHVEHQGWEQAQGWTKAIVVRLLRADTDDAVEVEEEDEP